MAHQLFCSNVDSTTGLGPVVKVPSPVGEADHQMVVSTGAPGPQDPMIAGGIQVEGKRNRATGTTEGRTGRGKSLGRRQIQGQRAKKRRKNQLSAF